MRLYRLYCVWVIRGGYCAVVGVSPIFTSGLYPLGLDIPLRLPSATDFLTIAEDLPGGRQEVSKERFWVGLSQRLKEG